MGKKYDNLVEELRNNPRNVRFETLQALLGHYGCAVRQPRGGSSHYIFTHPALPYRLTVPKDRPIKAIYVKKALQMIDDIKEVVSDETK